MSDSTFTSGAEKGMDDSSFTGSADKAASADLNRCDRAESATGELLELCDQVLLDFSTPAVRKIAVALKALIPCEQNRISKYLDQHLTPDAQLGRHFAVRNAAIKQAADLLDKIADTHWVNADKFAEENGHCSAVLIAIAKTYRVAAETVREFGK